MKNPPFHVAQWSRVMRTGIGKWWSFAAATIKGGSCPSISWKPMSTSSNILCLSTFKILSWKIFLRELSWKGCKSCQIHQVGRSVGWTWHSPQRSWRRWPRLMSTCCFSSWLVLTFKESNYRSRSFFAHGVRVCPRNIASTIHFLNEFSFSLHCVSLPMLAVCNQSHFGEQLICCDL